MTVAVVGLGSNVGQRERYLLQALDLLSDHPGIQSLRVSRFLETAAVGVPDSQAMFLNAATRVKTSLGSRELLALLHETEQTVGRTRNVRWEARVIDLDLLVYDEQESFDPTLTLPHRLFAFRRFALEPAVEIAADLRVPPLGKTIQELFAHLSCSEPHFYLLCDDLVQGEQLRVQLADVAREHPSTLEVISYVNWFTQPLLATARAIFWLHRSRSEEALIAARHRVLQALPVPLLLQPDSDLPTATREAAAVLKSMR